MILHLAFFRWNDGITDEDVTGLTAALTEMAAGLDVLRSYRCGVNLRVRPSTADYAVAAIVDDEDALVAYLDSPAHADVYERFLGRMIDERSAVQLPVGAGAAL